MYESNVMRDILINEGYIESEEMINSDIIIINTCSVTNMADKKSIKVIKHAIRENEKALLIVTGCSSQNKKEVYEKIEGIDILLGNINKSKIVDYIKRYFEEKLRQVDIRSMTHLSFEAMKLNNFNHTRAFIKIQDGCNNFCSYCIIPYVRGNIRSKELEDVLKEAKTLVQAGHREIVLTGIHTGNYGKDIGTSLSSLLSFLVKIKGLERIRISSIEIVEIDESVLDVIKHNNIIVDHMHIPLQSGCDTVLKRMNRRYDMKYFENKIKVLREIRPDMSITTDVIVGFPGETDEEFQQTIESIKRLSFSKLHVFPYSKREGTVASTLENQVDEKIKKDRVKVLLSLSKELEDDYANKFIGKTLTFLPEVYKDGYLIGHSGNYLLVRIKGEKKELGKIKEIVVTGYKNSYIEGNWKEKVLL